MLNIITLVEIGSEMPIEELVISAKHYGISSSGTREELLERLATYLIEHTPKNSQQIGSDERNPRHTKTQCPYCQEDFLEADLTECGLCADCYDYMVNS